MAQQANAQAHARQQLASHPPGMLPCGARSRVQAGREAEPAGENRTAASSASASQPPLHSQPLLPHQACMGAARKPFTLMAIACRVRCTSFAMFLASPHTYR